MGREKLSKWFPQLFQIADDIVLKNVVASSEEWQIYTTIVGSRVLVCTAELYGRWCEDGLLDEWAFGEIEFRELKYRYLPSDSHHVLSPVSSGLPILSVPIAEAFAVSLRETRRMGLNVPIHDGIFVERLSKLLPGYTLTQQVDDEVVLGCWLSRGLQVSIHSGRKFYSATGWLTQQEREKIVASAGLTCDESVLRGHEKGRETFNPSVLVSVKSPLQEAPSSGAKGFELVGREYLSSFFRDHIIDIVNNPDQYALMGIPFPAPIILHGPPGTGKTYAVQKLTDFLGWPLYEISSSSIGSPFIHETSKRIAKMFEEAIENSPAVIVIDEMDAYLGQRDAGEGKHSIEEISEFLRLIPVARERNVLIIGMTNRLDSIDPAILRKGRFDQIIFVDVASVEEIRSLLEDSIKKLPVEGKIDTTDLSKKLHGRPLSDISFLLREAGRLAAKDRSSSIDASHFDEALRFVISGSGESDSRRIGFI